MRILVVGDTHGNPKDILPKIYKAGELKIQHVLVVGDFGLWTHFADGHDFLDEVNEAARINRLSVYAIGGNHENWDHWNWFVDNMPTHKGFAIVRRRVLLAPKAHKWTWANKKFVGAGGAVSVDKQDRLENERKAKYGPKTLYWPNEQLADEDVWFIKTFGTADFLFTHDCSDFTPFEFRLKPDLDSKMHRQKIDRVLASVKPKFHFHGHMHTKYDWINAYPYGYSAFADEWDGPETRTIGLEAFQDSNSWGVLDVDSEQWFWPAELDKSLADRKARKAAAEVDPRTDAEKEMLRASMILAGTI